MRWRIIMWMSVCGQLCLTKWSHGAG